MRLNFLFTCVVVSTLVGCAAPASKQAMTVNPSDISSTKSENLKSAVSVRSVSGGKSTNPLWTSQVDNDGFKAALEESLAIAGYKASDLSKAKYFVDVELKRLDQPLVGIDFDVTSEVVYSVGSDSSKHMFPITATGTAKFSDNWVGYERLKAASEKAIKENITNFINQISKKFQ